MESYDRRSEEFARLDTELIFLSADPPEVSRRFRDELQLVATLVADEKHVTADHHGIPVCYRSPRVRVYPDGYIEPAVIAYHHDREIYRLILRPGLRNLWGMLMGPKPGKLLRILRRRTRGGADRRSR